MTDAGLPWGLRHWLREEFAALHQRFDYVDEALGIVRQEQEALMAKVDDALNDLETQVTRIEGAEDSTEALLRKLAELIAGLRTGSTDEATAARINELSRRVDARATALAAAVAAGDTGAQNPTPPQTPPPTTPPDTGTPPV